jgi:hypothetical protein
MMIKKLLSIVCAVAFALPLCAQVTWNAKGGIGFSACIGHGSDSKFHFVGKVGMGLEKLFSPNLSLMPSLEIAWKGENYLDKEVTEGKLDLFYIQIPIVLAYRINLSNWWNIAFKAGPYAAFALIGNYSSFNRSGGWSDEYNIFDNHWGNGKRFDCGIDCGIDFEYHRFVFGGEYELGFLEIYHSSRNQAVYFTIGYKF